MHAYCVTINIVRLQQFHMYCSVPIIVILLMVGSGWEASLYMYNMCLRQTLTKKITEWKSNVFQLKLLFSHWMQNKMKCFISLILDWSGRHHSYIHTISIIVSMCVQWWSFVVLNNHSRTQIPYYTLHTPHTETWNIGFSNVCIVYGFVDSKVRKVLLKLHRQMNKRR